MQGNAFRMCRHVPMVSEYSSLCIEEFVQIPCPLCILMLDSFLGITLAVSLRQVMAECVYPVTVACSHTGRQHPCMSCAYQGDVEQTVMRYMHMLRFNILPFMCAPCRTPATSSCRFSGHLALYCYHLLHMVANLCVAGLERS